MSRLPISVASKNMLPILAGSIALNFLLTPALFAEMSATQPNVPANAAADVKAAPAEAVLIEPAVSAVQVTSLQVEPGSGNLALQTTGAFLAPVLEAAGWPNRLTLTLPETALDPEFSNTPAEWLAALQAVMPEASGIQLSTSTSNANPSVVIALTFQNLPADAPKPQVLVNTGALLTVGLKPFDPTASRKGVSRILSSAVGLSNVPTPLPSNLNSLYAYFSNINPNEETTTKIDGLVFQAWREFLAGNNGNAILALRPYVERVPEDAAARYLLASAYLASGETSGADKELTALLLQHQESLPIVLQLLQVKLQAIPEKIREDRTLQPLLQQALKKWPSHAALHYYQAKYTLASGSLEDARQQLLQAIAHDPKADYYNLLGDIETRAGKPQAAKVAYWDALSLDPGNSESRIKLALQETHDKNQVLALKQYAKAYSPEALLNYSQLLTDSNQPEQALAALKMADLALGDPRSFSQMEQSKPLAYELGMRFAEFKEHTDAQRNLKLFLELSNLKPDSQNSENAKRVPAAKEMLQRLAYSTPATSKTASGKSGHRTTASKKTPATPVKTKETTTAAKPEKMNEPEKIKEKAKPANHTESKAEQVTSEKTPAADQAINTHPPVAPAAHNIPAIPAPQQAEALRKQPQPEASIAMPAVNTSKHPEKEVIQTPVVPPAKAPEALTGVQEPATKPQAIEPKPLPQSAPTKVSIPAIGQPEPIPSKAAEIVKPAPAPIAEPVKSVVKPQAPETKEPAVTVKETPAPQSAVSPAAKVPEPSPEKPLDTTGAPKPEAKPVQQTSAPVVKEAAPPEKAENNQTAKPALVEAVKPEAQQSTTPAKPTTILDPLPGAKQVESIPSPYYPQAGTFE